MHKDRSHKFKFSFVMPVYNVEQYLREAVDSIINQTIGFKENIQIIFVNDGSPDNSESICLDYKAKYPKNIKYIRQSNKGLSAARNRGVPEIEGKYTSFMDSDDVLSSTALADVYKFFEKHYDLVDFVSIRQLFFESREGDHPLAFKFRKSKVVDIALEYDHVQLSACSSFIKSAVLSRHLFDAKIRKFAEDMKFLTELVLEKGAYGIVSGPAYFYRQRSSGNSIIDGSHTDKYWYLGTPKDVYQYLFDLSKKKFGKVIPYIQYIVMYDLQWRFNQQSQSVLSKSEQQKYEDMLRGLVKDIDDAIIFEQAYLTLEQKLFIIKFAKQKNLAAKVRHARRGFFTKDKLISSHEVNNPTLRIEIIEKSKQGIVFEGFVSGLASNNVDIRLVVGRKNFVFKETNYIKKKQDFIGYRISEQKSIKCVIKSLRGDSIRAQMKSDDEGWVEMPIQYHRYSRIGKHNGAYRQVGDHILIRADKGLAILRNTKRNLLSSEFKYLLKILFKGLRIKESGKKVFYYISAKFGGGHNSEFMFLGAYAGSQSVGKSLLKAIFTPARSVLNNVYIVFVRLVYFALKRLFINKRIWLVSDRVNSAGDSGEVLFKYINQGGLKIHANIKCYFVISKDSQDFKRMKQYGRVINRDSFVYKLLFLFSEKIISSHADDFVINAFSYNVNHVVDLYNFDFVFLQHGVISDDLSDWLNKYNKNIKLFVTSAAPERQSIINGNYGYKEKDVRLTGLPRYDALENNSKSKLVLSPTWRRNLSKEADQKTGIRPYSHEFKSSDYFRFYQNLINDKRIAAALKRANMIGEFYLHPSFMAQIGDFRGNKNFHIKTFPYNYKQALSEGSLLITDYSSVAFDFAYMKKPVIYTQFDHDTFYRGHIYDPGYFSYDKNGLGPVCYDYEKTVAEIVGVIDGGCRMTTKYQNRVNDFFAYGDKNNSKRVFEAILQMGAER